MATPKPDADVLKEALGALGRHAGTGGSAVDPYLIWVILKLYLRDSVKPLDLASMRFSVLVEYKPNRAPTAGVPFKGLHEGLWPSHLHSTRFDDLRVRPYVATLAGLASLIDGAAAKNSPILRFELCTTPDIDEAQLPGAQAQQRAAAGGAGTSGHPSAREERQRAGDNHAHYQTALASQAQRRRAARPAPPSPDCTPGLPPLVCVVDDLCNYAAAGSGAPAVIGLWHQGGEQRTTDRLDGLGLDGTSAFKAAFEADASGWVPGMSSGALVGRKLKADALTAADAEALAYQLARYPDPLPRASHGAAVMSLVRGTTRQGNFGEPCVPAAPPQILFVQLPVPTVIDTSAGSLASHALDGIHHALEAAREGQTVIVNLSYGSHSGPHDGSSVWDAGLLELLQLFDGSAAAPERKTLHVVLPAGNSQRSRCHSHRHVSATKPVQTLRWQVQPDDPTDNFVEIWFPQGVDAQVKLTPPGGSQKEVATARRGTTSLKPELRVGWGVLYPKHVAQSAAGSMALVAVVGSAPYWLSFEPMAKKIDLAFAFDAGAPDLQANRHNEADATERSDMASRQSAADEPASNAPHGVWTIEVSAAPGAAQRDFQFHAWIMRGDAAPGRRQQRNGNAGRQSYFLDDDGHAVDPTFTLNGIACAEHPRLWVVGAMRRGDSTISRYSAAGPNRMSGDPGQRAWRTLGPDVVVAADASLNVGGLLCAGILSGSRLRMSGTSIAAASFTRKLFDHLAACQPAVTVALPEAHTPSRWSPSGNPCVADAPFELRGERDRRVGLLADDDGRCATNAPATPSPSATGGARSRR